jgi:hypothetical protein
LPYPVKGRIELLGYVDLHWKYRYPNSSCDVSVLFQDASWAQERCARHARRNLLQKLKSLAEELGPGRLRHTG